MAVRSADAPAPAPRPALYAGPLRLTAPTSSWFEPAPLAAVDFWSCAGLLDVRGEGELDVVLVGAHQLRVARRGVPGDGDVVVPLPLGERIADLGCAAADFDGDGRLDIAVSSASKAVVAYGEASGGFTVVALPDLPMPVTMDTPIAPAAGVIDADGDGRPDLYVGRSTSHAAQAFERDGCRVDAEGTFRCGVEGGDYPGAPNVFFHNLGGRRFEVFAAGVEDDGQTLSVGVFDFDGDGRQDLFACNDGEQNGVYLNRGGLRFEERADALGLTMRNHCMGIAMGDLDGDGRTDLVLADLGTPLVFLGQPGGFRQVRRERGFNPAAQDAWGTHAEDFDNDGDLDILYENNISVSYWADVCPDCGLDEIPACESLLYRNNGEGYFSAERAAELPDNGSTLPQFETDPGGQVSVVADVDGDGLLDVLLLRRVSDDRRLEPWLLRGRALSPGSHLTVELPQGARARVCVGGWCQVREMDGGHSYGAMHLNRLHFGLGSATSAIVSVEWPRGRWNALGTKPAGTRVVFRAP